MSSHLATNLEPLFPNIPLIASYTTTLPGSSAKFPQNLIIKCDFLKY